LATIRSTKPLAEGLIAMHNPPELGALRHALFFLLLAASNLSALAQTGADPGERDESEQSPEQIVVYGEPGETDSATKLNLTMMGTPQTVSAISRVQLDDFLLQKVNAALDYAPGVTVEEVETSRTYYTARGFDIVNFQYDGVGAPFTYGLNSGQQDSALYEQLEVVKGAAGLITGLANPSATINYIRKRPTEEALGAMALSLNEWEGVRLEGDLSGSLSERVRGRIVLVDEDSDSYLDRYTQKDRLGYGIIEGDVGDRTLMTLGHIRDDSDATGVLWGALPLVYSDGTFTDYDASVSTSPEWTYANSNRSQTFLEVRHEFENGWAIQSNLARYETDFASQLFYVYGTPDPVTELGLFGYASGYDSAEEQRIVDVFVSGSFTLGGREHDLVAGVNRTEIDNVLASYYDFVDGFPVLGSDWAAGTSPRPAFTEHDPFNDAADIRQEQSSVYFASRLRLTDGLSMLLGARQQEVEQRGFSYGGPADTDADETVPYVGVVYAVSDALSVYGSVSEVFVQQTFVDDKFTPLGPTQGESREIGFKRSFNDATAILTAAVFESENYNLGEFIGRDTTTGTAFYEGRNYDSSGYEIEIAGQLSDHVNFSAGYTHVDIEDEVGGQARPYVPSELLKLSATYSLPALPALKLGGVLKWQEDITTPHLETGATVRQEAYTLIDLVLRYDVNDHVTAALNLGNVTDEKFLNSIYWDQAYYGAPRNIRASVMWRY
jgi:outer membrane receptor for ferric coprogen and ferric-rhodotorulic acid